MAQVSDVEHILASGKYRYETFSSLLDYPEITRQQLALAGYIYREGACLCPRCGITINLEIIDKNQIYANNFFRKLHREKISLLGKRCGFLLCESGTNIDDLRSTIFSQEQERMQWIDAEQPEFSDYTTRLQTFQSWPYLQAENSYVTPSTLAKHGFYFSGPNDGVTCFYCGNILTGWSELIHLRDENIVQLEHAKYFPCRFINYTAGGKFVASAGFFHIVTDQDRRIRNPIPLKSSILANIPQSIDECLLTYVNWPEDAPISPKDLSETGFYYLGEGLKVKCYMCNLEVDDWLYGMTALGTHSRRRNNCEIIRAIRSTKTSEIQTVNEKWRLQTLESLSFGSPSDETLSQELAACGFYRFRNTDHIRCAYCGVLIKPKLDCSIMFQHRLLAKQSRKSALLDCLMVRAQCAVNVIIPDRKRFPEYREYQSIFERMKTFENYKERYQVDEEFIRERADAGFFLETMKRMRCFQCGNSLSIHDKRLQEKYPHYNMAKLHAHFYPTCEWVREILGLKYVAQVLFDHQKSNDLEHLRSYHPQFSSTSSRTTLNSCSSTSSATGLNFSDYSDESDDEGYETVATPFKAYFAERISPIQSPPLPTMTPPNGSLTTAPTDIVRNDQLMECNSFIMINSTNPFEQFAEIQKSPPLEFISTDTVSIDPCAYFAYEINRLDSFRKQNRVVFAQIKVEELAYAGFYLNAEGTMVRCPWCKVELTEKRFQKILNWRPIIPGSPLNDEPWTAMCVHRHENGQTMDKDHSWCPWVRREPHALFLNVMMDESRMKYPEYPSYLNIEKRVQSFELDWNYPSGSLLSNVMMAHAGFIHLGDGKVCCFYCGNKLCRFEPLDCPFEEHASYHPLCDYIVEKRGQSFVERVLKESLQVLSAQARQKYETTGSQRLKYIYYKKTGLTTNKTKRRPVPRLNSRLSSRSSRSRRHSTTNHLDLIENSCHLCCENLARYEYDPCRHYPMCGECSVKLTAEQHEQCIICRRPAKIAQINSRF